eukprot:1518098-Alexandrium_andersonii.AAC.1
MEPPRNPRGAHSKLHPEASGAPSELPQGLPPGQPPRKVDVATGYYGGPLVVCPAADRGGH